MITLVHIEGKVILPIYFRIYNVDADNKIKNDHFHDMLDKAKERGFKPKLVMFDTCFASLKNLKPTKGKEWNFVTRLKIKLFENPDNTKNMLLETVEILPKELGFIRKHMDL
ncbi:MAG: hypothetical protein EHM20_12055 [Alphaproteobacteria bacterium]|nr:MAG: hypothetical protein EHM20_12055 [Alphaproteobacteria bacterium]